MKRLNQMKAKLNDGASIILPAFKYLTGASENICRLCFGVSDGGVYLDESCPLEGCDEDVGTFEDMLRDLGVTIDPCLPHMLCDYCADLTKNLWLFHKLCQLSIKRWQEAIVRCTNILDQTESLTPSVRTTFLILKNESNIILTTEKAQKEKDITKVLENIQRLMKARERRVLKKKPSSVICDECDVKFHSKDSLIRHKKIHKRMKFPCPKCPLVLTSKLGLGQHLNRVHRPKRIQCAKCNKMFSTESILKYHDAQYHRSAMCEQCGIQCPSKKDLRLHMFKHSNKECPYCGKTLTNANTFKNHLKICKIKEVDRLKFVCDICNKTYATKVGVKSHLVTFHGFGQVFYCDWCKKPFDSVSKMKNHTVKHTKERNFHCEQCGGKFVTLAALQNHFRLHTGETPFPCDVCGESFMSASRRMEHKRRKHIGPEKECTVCHSKFITIYELKKHMARHMNPRSRFFIGDNGGDKTYIKQTIFSCAQE